MVKKGFKIVKNRQKFVFFARNFHFLSKIRIFLHFFTFFFGCLARPHWGSNFGKTGVERVVVGSFFLTTDDMDPPSSFALWAMEDRSPRLTPSRKASGHRPAGQVSQIPACAGTG